MSNLGGVGLRSPFGGGTISSPILAPDGSASAPSYAFANSPTDGVFQSSAGNVDIALGGANIYRFTTTGILLGTDAASFIKMGAASDVVLARDAADVAAFRRSTNAQTFRVYNTYTDASNNEFLALRWTSNVMQVTTVGNGTGSARALTIYAGTGAPLNFGSNGTTVIWRIDTSGHLIAQGGDNAYDIGASGATRPRTGYFGTALAVGTNPASAGAVRIANGGIAYWRNAANSGDIFGMYVDGSDALIIGNTSAVGGIVLGSTSSAKVALWGGTPAVQPSSTGEATGYTGGGGTALTHTDTFTGNSGTKAYTINDLVKHLKATGILASS